MLVNQESFCYFQNKYQGQFSATIGYSEERAHKIYGGADVFLMPSQFEPCGLSQLISMRYGTVPIVRETGGLKDTVPLTIPDSLPETSCMTPSRPSPPSGTFISSA